ncbi:ABC transporter permease [Nocardiopsis oceani]
MTTRTATTPGRAPLSATRELLGLHTREFVRDHRNSVVALVLPLALAALFFTMAEVVPEPTGPGAESVLSFQQMIVPIVLLLTVTSAPLTGTAGPLVNLRAQGFFRLLGTTPVGRARLLLTHMPVRLGLVLFQVTVLIGAGAALGHVAPDHIPALFGASLLGLLLFGAVGYLIGGVMRGVDAATHTALFVQMGSVMLSFMFLPMGMLPESFARAVGHFPPSYLADLFFGQTPGWEPLHPVWQSVLVLLGTTVLLVALAVRLFRWDQGEKG